jgi:hypothetical protein
MLLLEEKQALIMSQKSKPKLPGQIALPILWTLDPTQPGYWQPQAFEAWFRMGVKSATLCLD